MAIQRIVVASYEMPKLGHFARLIVRYNDVTLDVVEISIEQRGFNRHWFALGAGIKGLGRKRIVQRGGRPKLNVAGMKMELVPQKRGGAPMPWIETTFRMSRSGVGFGDV